VCTGELGQPIGYRNLTRAFKRLCEVAGVKEIRLYDLRHTAISLMAESGADIKAISEVAGHANVLITRTIYQHVNRNQRAAVLAALSSALEGPEGQSEQEAKAATS
jgi:integrase